MASLLTEPICSLLCLFLERDKGIGEDKSIIFYLYHAFLFMKLWFKLSIISDGETFASLGA